MFWQILVPLDGSRLAELALPPAKELALRFGSTMTLVRVTPHPPIASSLSEALYAELLGTLRNRELDEARAYLRSWQTRLRQEGVKAAIQAVEGAAAGEMILEVAQALGTDLIVMSTHGRSGVKRWMYGSVADKVLRRASAPVLLIRNSSDSACEPAP